MRSAESILAGLEIFGVRLGLERSRQLLEELGDPQGEFPVVLVAGTNGKGSTSALLASMVGAAGYRVGLYTSPHLEVVEERIRINGRSIDSQLLARHLEEIVAVGGRSTDSPPTYFEALTAAAFVQFRDQKVDLAVMEVGLGGRLDATNVVEPRLSLITSIALDHQHVLGSTLGLIAREKAGILRPATPALCWVEADEARQALFEHSAALGTPLEDVRQGVRWQEVSAPDSELSGLRLDTPSAGYDLDLRIGGVVQRRNAGLAVRAAETLQRSGFERLDTAAIERGVAACRWPGRLEEIALDGGRRVLLDGAHNEEAMHHLRQHLASMLSRGGDPLDLEPFTLIYGALSDKPAARMLETISAIAQDVLLTAPRSSRAVDPQALRAQLHRIDAQVEPTAAQALVAALELESPLVVVCGSLYLAGEMRQEVRRLFGVPEAAVATRITC